jgi:hypothetical protein
VLLDEVELAHARALKQMEFDRANAAMRVQIGAVMKNISAFAGAARNAGTTDTAAFGQSLEQLNPLIGTWKYCAALRDFQAEALYDAVVTLNAAYKAASASAWADPVVTKGAFLRTSEVLRKFWVSMGEAQA